MTKKWAYPEGAIVFECWCPQTRSCGSILEFNEWSGLDHALGVRIADSADGIAHYCSTSDLVPLSRLAAEVLAALKPGAP